MPGPIARLDDAPGQWVLDRPDILSAAPRGPSAIAQMLAVVISASGPHMALPHAELVRAVDAQLRRLQPALPPCAWSLVDRREARDLRVHARRAAAGWGRALPPGIYLAGDYVDDEYPATLEAAVRSGIAAAEACSRTAADARSVDTGASLIPSYAVDPDITQATTVASAFYRDEVTYALARHASSRAAGSGSAT